MSSNVTQVADFDASIDGIHMMTIIQTLAFALTVRSSLCVHCTKWINQNLLHVLNPLLLHEEYSNIMHLNNSAPIFANQIADLSECIQYIANTFKYLSIVMIVRGDWPSFSRVHMYIEIGLLLTIVMKSLITHLALHLSVTSLFVPSQLYYMLLSRVLQCVPNTHPYPWVMG